MGTHNQNLLPGSDNTYDLGSSSYQWKRLYIKQAATDLIPENDNSIDLGSASNRWKKLYLRADSGTAIEQYKDGMSPAKVWELDHRGITRSEFEGTATLTPADEGNPDVIQVTLPRYIECDFVVFVCGAMGAVSKNTTIYDVYPYWHGPIYVCSPVSSGFQAHVTWDVFYRSNSRAFRPNGNGPWSNLRRLCEDMGGWSLDDIPTGTKTLHWIARWPL